MCGAGARLVRVVAWASLIALVASLPDGTGAPAAHPRTLTPVHASPGEGAVPWREMRLKWRRPVATKQYAYGARELEEQLGRVYYVSEIEVGCLSSSSGGLLWRQELYAPGQPQASWPEGGFRHWRLTVTPERVVTWEDEPPLRGSRGRMQIRAYQAMTGRPLWRQSLAARVLDAAPAAQVLLVAMESGALLALRLKDGAVAWQRQWARAEPHAEEEWPGARVRAAGGLAAAIVGGGLVIGFRARDGRQLWEYHPPELSTKEAQDGRAEGLALRGGVVYAIPSGREVVALDLRSGRPRWRRRLGEAVGFAARAAVVGRAIIADLEDTVAALDAGTGRTLWFRSRRDAVEWILPVNASPGPLLLKSYGPPRIGERQVWTASVPSLDIITAVDPVTGRAGWRWQPDEGMGIWSCILKGDQVFITDTTDIACFNDGQPVPAPLGAEARRRVAETAVRTLFPWWTRPGTPHTRSWGVPSDALETAAQLTLLRLGPDSVPSLMAYERDEIGEDERILPGPEEVEAARRYVPERSRVVGLTLLADLGDPGASAELSRWCDRVRNVLLRDALAAALVRAGCVTAAGPLFRYSRSEAGDPEVRRAALAFAARAGEQPDLQQDEVTAYLLEQLAKPMAPSWLRRYAKFELLDDRGDEARRAALATFDRTRTTDLMPSTPISALDGRRSDANPFGLRELSRARDEQGTWWLAALCDYLGGPNHLWFAQSRDGKAWEKPAFAADLHLLLDRVGRAELTCRGTDLAIELKGERWVPYRSDSAAVTQRVVIPVADLYRDRDGDGLPDRLEEQIGTDPANPDTNGNGIRDAQDPNPLYRAHPLSDEEGIYAAALEGLCQLGRTAAPRHEPGRLNDVPSLLGRASGVLLLPAPPGSPSIEVRGHPGTAVCRPGVSAREALRAGSPAMFVRFTPPLLDLVGTWRGEQPQAWDLRPGPARDPFGPPPAPTSPAEPSFRDFFPYAMSPDHTRARVGLWEGFVSGSTVGIYFDVEVRKIGGNWSPVECREVASTWQGVLDDVLAPVRPLQATPVPSALLFRIPAGGAEAQ